MDCKARVKAQEKFGKGADCKEKVKQKKSAGKDENCKGLEKAQRSFGKEDFYENEVKRQEKSGKAASERRTRAKNHKGRTTCNASECERQGKTSKRETVAKPQGTRQAVPEGKTTTADGNRRYKNGREEKAIR